MDFDKVLTIITWAGITGLIILNAGNSAQLLNAAGSNATSYVKAVQGR